MLEKRFFVIHFLLLLFFVLSFPIPTLAKESTIQNPYYVFSWDENGNVRITDLAKNEILSSIQYQAEYGTIYNSMTPSLPKGSKQITLDQSPPFQPGAAIEIRSESFGGRMNAPLVHQAKVTSVRGNDLYFSPPTTKVIDRNIFIKRGSHWVRKWDDVKVEHRETATGNTVIVTGHTPIAVVSTQYALQKNSPAIDITVKTTYKRAAKVFRETFALQFKQNVTEVYRKNRKVDTKKFQASYWLDHQGAKFGQGKQAAFLYHAPNVSSLELNTTQKQLIVNLDHMNDHRYVQQTSTNQVGKVRHASEYRANDVRTNSFSLVVGYQPKLMPRFMSQPSGFLATHVWTEHADEQTLQTNRAVYFGSEKISSSAQATGGFVKHRIPVTKSVFYSNPYFQAKSPINVAIAQSPEFLQFLDDLNRNGDDIGLHTLYPYEIRHYQKTTEDALQVMKDHFQSRTWIDHGYLKSSFAFNALDIQTANYLAHQWKKYGTSYFWHYSSEDIANPNNGLDLYQSQKGDSLRTPLYWSHPTVTGPFYSWSAAIIPEYSVNLYREQNLQQLIQNRGVFINHTYLARFPSKKQGGKFIIRDAQGNWIIHPDFDRLLKRMETLRDQGQLHLTTVREIMDYWLALSQVRMEYAPNGSIILHNRGEHKISSLSMATKASEVYVNGMKPSQKKADGDLIFWFDLEPNAVAIIAANKLDSIAFPK
ncbi:hypothetical protein BBR47_27830 [Brevibacillus brevis NBRC 100599]|uniref:Uncharacterized protein n=1 Tax=Brevibacillus brevis (strain 47 / JCM 6285 / NBRC 100599) TaxID=358681 RepID=C0ZDA1_BREBN|nr:hypothetical protein [Brevibacillus brevis]BAH43760.1 hypothetical protein BBR47_27830 [Brevibacillus brevis NBRC 100599]